jgi:hypothetical protein
LVLLQPLSRVYYRGLLYQHPSWFLSPYELLGEMKAYIEIYALSCASFILILFSNTKIPVPSK